VARLVSAYVPDDGDGRTDGRMFVQHVGAFPASPDGIAAIRPCHMVAADVIDGAIYRSPGTSPVRFAIRASIFGPTSTPLWNANT
jgi:hypothetical protein